MVSSPLLYTDNDALSLYKNDALSIYNINGSRVTYMRPRMLPIILLDLYIEYILILLFVRRSHLREARDTESDHSIVTLRYGFTTAFYYTHTQEILAQSEDARVDAPH